jgi:hypothetical protein
VRRLPAIVLGALLLAACSDDDDDAGVVDRSRPVPADVQAFLDRVADPSALTFVADYDLLNKNGGGEHVVHVESDPPTLTVTIDGTAVDLDDEPALAQYGIFSGFLAANPSAAIEATARRPDAGDAVHSTREAAGLRLDCIAIPVQGVAASTTCITDDGLVGYVDNPAVRYELTGRS